MFMYSEMKFHLDETKKTETFPIDPHYKNHQILGMTCIYMALPKVGDFVKWASMWKIHIFGRIQLKVRF